MNLDIVHYFNCLYQKRNYGATLYKNEDELYIILVEHQQIVKDNNNNIKHSININDLKELSTKQCYHVVKDFINIIIYNHENNLTQ